MNISFLKNEPLDTVIVDSTDGRPLFEVKTPFKLTERTTTVRRAEGGLPGGGGVIAQIHWHEWSSNKITYGGTEMKMAAFLRKSDGFLSDSKILTGSDGREYKWKHSSGKFKLTDCQTKAMVAQSHRRKIGIFSEPRKMNIDISEQGIPNIDVIVVSFIIMEEMERERDISSDFDEDD